MPVLVRIVEHGTSKSNTFELGDDGAWLKCSSYKGQFDTALSAFMHVFLPAGYPTSVRPEYLRYQLWDCLQGLTSYLRGCLTTQALLKGAGVGVSDASPVTAALTWVLKDGVGMASSLLVAYVCSTNFEVNTKEWRLLADFLNNLGLFLNMLVSVFPSHFLLLGCLSAVSHSLCGLLAGATRARISAHFVVDKGSLADVTAKESTQETAVTLAGLLLGMVFTGLVGDNALQAWALFIVLTAVHQWANYELVRTLVFDTLNPQRCCLLAEDLLEQRRGDGVGVGVAGSSLKRCLSPAVAACNESIFTPIELLFRGPRCGVSLDTIFSAVRRLHGDPDPSWSQEHSKITDPPGSQQWLDRVPLIESEMVRALLQKYRGQSFVVGVDMSGRLVVCFEKGTPDSDVLKSYFVCLYIYHCWTGRVPAGCKGYVFDRISWQGYCSIATLGKQYHSLVATSIIDDALQWYEKCLHPNFVPGAETSLWNVSEGAVSMDVDVFRYELEFHHERDANANASAGAGAGSDTGTDIVRNIRQHSARRRSARSTGKLK